MTWTISQEVTVLAEGSPVRIDRVVSLCADGAPRLNHCKYPFNKSGWVKRGGCRYTIRPATDEDRNTIEAAKAWERLRQITRTPGQRPSEVLIQQLEGLLRVVRKGLAR